jgi:hypothetical protein
MVKMENGLEIKKKNVRVRIVIKTVAKKSNLNN